MLLLIDQPYVWNRPLKHRLDLSAPNMKASNYFCEITGASNKINKAETNKQRLFVTEGSCQEQVFEFVRPKVTPQFLSVRVCHFGSIYFFECSLDYVFMRQQVIWLSRL